MYSVLSLLVISFYTFFRLCMVLRTVFSLFFHVITVLVFFPYSLLLGFDVLYTVNSLLSVVFYTLFLDSGVLFCFLCLLFNHSDVVRSLYPFLDLAVFSEFPLNTFARHHREVFPLNFKAMKRWRETSANGEWRRTNVLYECD
jgi:hypothetical protein